MERKDPELETLAREVFESLQATLRRRGTSARWISPLERHVFPKIGRKRVSQIHQSDIKATLQPIWQTKHPTAEKAIQRLRIIFRQGKLAGYECDPFTVDAARQMLGAVIHRPQSMPATPWQDVPAMFARFEGRGVTAACLRLIMLTVVRGYSARGARFSEIENGVWTIPSERMKGAEGRVKEFRVPLSDAALELVESRRGINYEQLFAGPRGGPISDAALSKFMRDNNEPGTPHGFRTSFRTWVQETNACDWDVSETVLAHTIGGKVERAYARSDLLDRRRVVMNKWAGFVTGTDGKIVRFK